MVLASLGIVLGGMPDAFAQGTDAAPVSPPSPTLEQAQKAQRKADRKAVRAKKAVRTKNSAELSKLEKNGYSTADDRSDYPANLQRAQ